MKISVTCTLLYGKINAEYLLYYCNHKSCHCTYNPPLCLLVQLRMYMVTLVSQNAHIVAMHSTSGLLPLFRMICYHFTSHFKILKWCYYFWINCGGFIFTADFFEFMSKFVIIPHAIILWMLGHPRGYENVNM